MTPQLLILDLDGTVRRCTVPGQPCPNRIGEQALLPGVVARIQTHLAAGGALAFATNQGGVGLGFMTEEEHLEIVTELYALLVAEGLYRLNDDPREVPVFTCPHAPDAGCSCRKPAPGLLLHAMADAGIGAPNTLFVGDRASDRQAAQAAGCGFMWAWDWNPDHPADLRPAPNVDPDRPPCFGCRQPTGDTSGYCWKCSELDEDELPAPALGLDWLRRDIAVLEALLARLPADEVLSRVGLESRLESQREALAAALSPAPTT